MRSGKGQGRCRLGLLIDSTGCNHLAFGTSHAKYADARPLTTTLSPSRPTRSHSLIEYSHARPVDYLFTVNSRSLASQSLYTLAFGHSAQHFRRIKGTMNTWRSACAALHHVRAHATGHSASSRIASLQVALGIFLPKIPHTLSRQPTANSSCFYNHRRQSSRGSARWLKQRILATVMTL